jgi:hypothetical protein
VLVYLLAIVLPAGAQPTDEERRAAMVQTVVDQLAAFRRGDWATAYGYASAAIKDRFPPEAFRRMVTQGYAAIADSVRSTVLGAILLTPQHGMVEIRVEGRNGQTIDALYELVDEQGAWRIAGVVAKPTAPGELVRAGLRPGAGRRAA